MCRTSSTERLSVMNRKGTMRATTLVTLLFLGASALLCADRSNALPMSKAEPETVLVDCAGRYVRLGTAGSIVAEGGLWDDSSMSGLRVDADSGFEGCLVTGIQSDAGRGILYAVLTREPREDSEGRRHYVVVALDSKKLVRLAQIELETAIAGGVSILLSSDRQELVLSYSRYEEAGGQGAWRNLLERFSAPALTRVKTQENLHLEDAPGLPSSTHLSNSASWIDGHRILNDTTVLDEDGHVLEQLNPYDLIPVETANELSYLRKPGTPGRTYLPISYADSAGGRVLFIVGHDLVGEQQVGSALWIYDAAEGTSLRPIRVPETVAAYDPGTRGTPTAHLTPDGNSILLESYQWQSGGADGNVRVKTGDLRLYDVASGKLTRTFNLEPAPGVAARLLGFSPDGAIAFIGSSNRLYSIPLDRSAPITVARSTRGFDPFWTIGLAVTEKPERPR